MWTRRDRIIALAASLCLTLALLPGCGKPPRATVKGKVTFNRMPVSGATVSFVDANNRTGSSLSKADGSYEVQDAPVGEVTITVFTPPLSQAMTPQGKQPKHKGMPTEMLPPGHQDAASGSKRFTPVPEKYHKADTSPLKFTVQRGSQDKDIELMP